MKRKTFGLVLGGLILLGTAVSPRAEMPFQNKELDQFFRAKASVFAGDWPGVRSGMEAYLKDYPAGKMRDEALYWLAGSLDRLARDARDVVAAIDLKKKAFDSLDRLIKEFPGSLWRDDAKESQVAVAGGLAVLGVEEQRKFLEEAIRSNVKNGLEIKTAALNSIIALDSKTALPVLRNFLSTESEADLRKHAVRLLGEKYPREARPILEEAVKNDRDPEVRKEAESWLEKIRMRLIPFKVSYYCFETRVTDTSAYAKVPEGKVAQFAVPHGPSGNEARIKKAIGRIFDGQVEFTGSKATMNSDVLDLMGGSRIAHTIAGFNVELAAASIVKTENDISGRVRFGEMEVPFKADKANDVILAARRGDRQAVMYLDMSPKDVDEDEIEDENESRRSVKDFLKAPSYRNAYRLSGMVVYSDRNVDVFDPDSFKSNLFDYGQAVAEIPGPGGTWTLTGQLLFLNKERILIGRMAKLVRPDGTAVAAGEEIRVPAGNPAGYTVGAGADPKFPTTFNLDGGGRIQSSRPQIGSAETAGDVVDFGSSRVFLSGPGGTWTLTGRVVFLREEQKIVARDAALTNPEGKTAAQGAMIIVPVKNPEKFTLVAERSN